ncbi:MAG: PorT family protein [Lentimicrobiaceae bacterium]|nr:PorT family protein [Lentimicrobiaceae bacterium]
MKKVIIIIIAATCSLFATAQTTHEFSINGGGGLSSFAYKAPPGKNKLGFGGEFGLGYTCVFGKTVGIHIGADLSFYKTKADLNGVNVVTAKLTDNEGDSFDMHSTLNSYNEIQNAMFLNIPVMLHIQAGQDHKFYAMAGVKAGIPLSCKYKVSNFTLTNKAYYPEYDNWLTDQEFAGYGKFENINSNGKQKYQISVALALEAGAKWKITKKFAIYTGVYFDYGLTNIIKKNDQQFVNYNNLKPAEFTTHSALSSATNKMNVMAVGLKVRLALSPKGAEKSSEKEKVLKVKTESQKDKEKKSDKEKAPKVKAEKPPKTKKVKSENIAQAVDVMVEEIEAASVEVELTAAEEFTLGRPGREGFPATAMGITWISNIDGQTAKFTTASNALVILPDQTAYNAITTQETLKTAFDAGAKLKEYTAKAGASFKPLYLIVQDGETLYLIEMISLQFKAGDSKAYFRVKN